LLNKVYKNCNSDSGKKGVGKDKSQN